MEASRATDAGQQSRLDGQDRNEAEFEEIRGFDRDLACRERESDIAVAEGVRGENRSREAVVGLDGEPLQTRVFQDGVRRHANEGRVRSNGKGVDLSCPQVKCMAKR